MAITRRTLLRYGLGGGLLLLAGGAGLSLQPSRRRAPRAPLRALDERSFSVLAAVVDRMLPPRPGYPSAAELGIAERVDAFLAEGDPAVARKFRHALLLLENGLAGFLFDGRARHFARLPPEAQDRVLDAWRTSAWSFRRMVYRALHGLCMAVYSTCPEVFPAVGYPGPPPLGGAP